MGHFMRPVLGALYYGGMGSERPYNTDFVLLMRIGANVSAVPGKQKSRTRRGVDRNITLQLPIPKETRMKSPWIRGT